MILGHKNAEQAILPSGVENLSILANSSRPVNPSELLESSRFGKLLDELRDQYDLIIIDTPPVLLVSDPAIVAPLVDGLLIMLRVDKGTKTEAVRTRNILAGLNVNILGLLISKGDTSNRDGDYSYGYNYTYDEKTYGEEYGYGYDDTTSDRKE